MELFEKFDYIKRSGYIYKCILSRYIRDPLVCEKIAGLKSILKECVTKEQYDQTDKTISAAIRKMIYNAKINKDTTFSHMLIDTSKEDAKNIWNNLSGYLPMYFLFKSDRVNSDKDSEVQSPMKTATQIVLESMKPQIETLCQEVNKEVTKIGERTIKKLGEFSPDIAEMLKPNMKTKPFESVFSFDLLSDDDIPLNKRGSGIRRLILLSYFRAEAEESFSLENCSDIIYAIEEPETSQHPNYQMMILESLQKLSEDGMHQIIMTTHTPEIAKMVELEQLILIDKDINGVVEFEENNERKYASIAETLGILPFAVSKVVICVEGKNDSTFLYQ